MVDPLNDPVWWSVTRIANRDGISPQAVSKAVKRLISQHGLEVERGPHGSVRAINIAHYDRLRGAFGDSAQKRGAPVQPVLPSEDTLDGARLAKIRIETEHSRLSYQAEIGQLVRRDLMADAVTRLGEDLAREVDLTLYTDRIAAAAARGLPALRTVLKSITNEIKTGMADHCERLAMVAPVFDEPHKEPVAA